MKFAVVKLDRAHVLLAALHRFVLPVELDLLRHFRRSHRHCQGKKRQQENGYDHGEPIFRRTPVSDRRMDLCSLPSSVYTICRKTPFVEGYELQPVHKFSKIDTGFSP